MTLKRDRVIPTIIQQHNPADFLSKMTFLEAGLAIILLYLRFIERYNLLPNDALILATCKLNGIEQMASYDADCSMACRGEGIRLIRSVSEIKPVR